MVSACALAQSHGRAAKWWWDKCLADGVGTQSIVRDNSPHRKRLLALLVLAPVIAGCSGGVSEMFSSDLLSKDAEWFSRPGRLFIRNIEAPPLSPNKPVGPEDLISAQGYCPGMAPPTGPADANALTNGAAGTLDDRNGRAWSYRVRRRARDRRAGQCQYFQQWARRPGGGHYLFARPARRNLYLHIRSPDLDRARG